LEEVVNKNLPPKEALVNS